MPPITKRDLADALNEFYEKVIEPRFDRIESYLQTHVENRFDRIEQKLENHDQRFSELLGHFGEIYSRLDRLETEYFAINASLKRIEDRLDRVEEKVDKEISLRERLEREVSDLKQRALTLQSQIEEIENRLKILPS